MRLRTRTLATHCAMVALVFSAFAFTASGTAAIEEEELTEVGTAIHPARGVSHSVKLENVRFGPDGSIAGDLVNKSSELVRDIRLLVRYDWRWEDERNPGEDSPGRSLYVTVGGDLPALGSLPVEYTPSPPLPSRDDGRFAPSVEVAGYTEVRFKKVIRPSR